MNTKRKIQILISFLAVLSVLVIVLSRNAPHYDEQKSAQKGEEAPAEFNPPSKSNVAPAFTARVEELKQSVQKNPKNAPHLILLAQLLMDGHQNKEAIVYFEKAALIQPANDSLLLDLSVCYFNDRQYEKALKTTDRILSRDRYHSRALYNKGAILASIDRKKEAVSVWNVLLQHHPESDEAKTVREHISMLEKQ